MISKIKNKIDSDKNLLELIKGGSVSFIFQIIGIGLSYLFILFVSRFYGAEGMGIFALSFTVLNIFVLFGKFGLDVSIVKFIGELSEKKDFSSIKDIYLKIITLAVPVNILLSTLLFFVAPYLSEYVFHKPKLTLYFQLISLGILPMSLRFIHANAIRGLRNIKLYSFLQNISMYMFSLLFLIIFFFIGTSNEIGYAIVSLLLGLFMGLCFSTYFWFKESGFLKRMRTDSITIKKILSISTPLLISSSIMLILGLADTVMLGIFKTEADVGVYNVTYKIATAGMIVFMAMSSITTPKIATAYGNNDIKLLKKTVLQSTKLIAIFSLPIYIGIFLFSTQILSIFGNEFISGTLTLTLLTIGFFIKSIFGTSEYILQMSNQQKSLIIFATFVALINILLNYLLIPEFGIVGASFASMLSIIVYQYMLVIQVKKLFKLLSNKSSFQ